MNLLNVLGFCVANMTRRSDADHKENFEDVLSNPSNCSLSDEMIPSTQALGQLVIVGCMCSC
jgi:hypothetical protein